MLIELGIITHLITEAVNEYSPISVPALIKKHSTTEYMVKTVTGALLANNLVGTTKGRGGGYYSLPALSSAPLPLIMQILENPTTDRLLPPNPHRDAVIQLLGTITMGDLAIHHGYRSGYMNATTHEPLTTII